MNAEAGSTLVPLEAFFGLSDRALPRLNHAGTHLAYLARKGDRMALVVEDIRDGATTELLQGLPPGIRTLEWSHSDRHLLYLMDSDGDELVHLMCVDIDGGKPRDLTPFPGVLAQLVRAEGSRPGSALVGLNRRDPTTHDLHEVDLETGAIELIAENPGFQFWLFGGGARPCAGLRPNVDGTADVLAIDSFGAWRSVVRLSADDFVVNTIAGALGASHDGNTAYLLSYGDGNGNECQLVALDLQSGRMEVAARDVGHDVTEVIMDASGHVPALVASAKSRKRWRALLPDYEDDLKVIAERCPGDLAFFRRDDADESWLLGMVHPQRPVTFYLYDRQAKTARELMVHAEQLRHVALSEMRPFSLIARDGLELNGYMTVPDDQPDRLPTVLYVHGGPWHRDSWSFEPMVQFLASRGYLCLQVNFRSSVGLGRDVLRAGDREWGGAMHDDLVDTIDWAISQGITDPSRVAIMGGSYGGYAVLWAATSEGSPFSCAVASCPPTNLITFLRAWPEWLTTIRAQFFTRVGDPDLDADRLWERSPLRRADSLSMPLLLAAGGRDPRARPEEAESFLQAVRKAGKECEFLLFPDEGHGFAKLENRLTYYRAVERFLEENIGASGATVATAGVRDGG